MRNLFTKDRLDVLSQLFTNLAAGWFGVVFIAPGITNLASLDNFSLLIKNLLLGIVSLLIAIRFKEKK